LKTAEEFYDEIADSYDDQLERGFISSVIRSTFQEKLVDNFHSGTHLLDIGCGTGTDAVFLAGIGINVTAFDISPKMLEIARNKVKNAGLNGMIEFKALSAEDIGKLNGIIFDGAYSNFDSLNHVKDLHGFSQKLSSMLKPKSKFIVTTLNRFCLLEVLYYASKLNLKKAAVKMFKREKEFESGANLYYPREIKRIFSAEFFQKKITGIGLFVPPDQVYKGMKFRKFFTKAAGIETGLTKHYPFYNMCDHYIMEFEKK